MTGPGRVALDTHALLWWLGGDSRLSKKASRAIERSSEVVVSAMSVWEVAMLLSKGRIELDRPVAVWANDLAATDGIAVLPVDSPTAVLAAGLPSFHGDPADRMIVATAVLGHAELVTKDDRIQGWARASGQLVTVW